MPGTPEGEARSLGTPDSARGQGAARPFAPGPLSLDGVIGLFPEEASRLGGATVVVPGAVPEPYHRLLVHEHHMTVTLEAFYRQPVVLRVLEVRQDGESYARKLVLTAGDGGPVVLFGIMRFRLGYSSDEVREEILRAKTPLGRILVEHGVLRRIWLDSLLHFDTRRGLGEAFGLPSSAGGTYGRLARIYCDGLPAVELLEIVVPAPAGGGSEARRDADP